MAVAIATKGAFSLKAYPGNNKTLLAFSFASAKNLAGFSISCKPIGQPGYCSSTNFNFKTPVEACANRVQSTICHNYAGVGGEYTKVGSSRSDQLLLDETLEVRPRLRHCRNLMQAESNAVGAD